MNATSAILHAMTDGLGSHASIIKTLTSLCPDVDDEVLRDFVSRMDPEYFERFEPEAVAYHIQLASRLTPDHPCELSVLGKQAGRSEISIVAYDYFSEFSAICGILSAFGLNIEEGQIYTFVEAVPSPLLRREAPSATRRPKGRPGLSRKKIVDVFLVHPIEHTGFPLAQQQALQQTVTEIIQLLDAGRFDEARQYVNRRLVERLDKHRSAFTGLLHTVQITFDNSQSPTDTIMDIQSDDTPAFLYALANALAMRNIYITKAQIECDGLKLRDRFYVRNRDGQKLLNPADQQQLRLTAVLIKQFTHALTWASDPAKALASFDHFLDLIVAETGKKGKNKALDFISDKKTFPLLARLLGASDFLWQDFLRRQHHNLLPLLTEYRDAPLIKPQATLRKELDRVVARAKTDEARKDALNRFKDSELFRIDMKHIVDASPSLTDFSLALTQLAEVIMARSVVDCQTKLGRLYGRPLLQNRKPCPFAVLALGKFGGRELGYASDIELLFVYGGEGSTNGKTKMENSEYFERLVQELLQWIEAKQEGIFHLDVRLRPHGGKSSLANVFEAGRDYCSPTGYAAPFERQALIKLRHIVGDVSLGRQMEAHRDSFVYGKDPWDIPGAVELRRQQLKQLVKPGQVNLKYGAGGLIDIEYAVQYLQVMHGHDHPSLRTPNTLQALAALVNTGLVSRTDGEALRKAYLFTRILIDGLRMVRGNAKDLVLPPPDSEEFVSLARRVGYTTDDWRACARHLQADIAHHMHATREFFSQQFGGLYQAEEKPIPAEPR
jgi:[glutamine synthetase] adenylyltransferase / [glutamine synthetase]-adenylyl-L-tyrosine phosphorylase